eukprot:ANDGO_03265.mRNA.1 hypothetical protein
MDASLRTGAPSPQKSLVFEFPSARKQSELKKTREEQLHRDKSPNIDRYLKRSAETEATTASAAAGLVQPRSRPQVTNLRSSSYPEWEETVEALEDDHSPLRELSRALVSASAQHSSVQSESQLIRLDRAGVTPLKSRPKSLSTQTPESRNKKTQIAIEDPDDISSIGSSVPPSPRLQPQVTVHAAPPKPAAVDRRVLSESDVESRKREIDAKVERRAAGEPFVSANLSELEQYLSNVPAPRTLHSGRSVSASGARGRTADTSYSRTLSVPPSLQSTPGRNAIADLPKTSPYPRSYGVSPLHETIIDRMDPDCRTSSVPADTMVQGPRKRLSFSPSRVEVTVPSAQTSHNLALSTAVRQHEPSSGSKPAHAQDSSFAISSSSYVSGVSLDSERAEPHSFLSCRQRPYSVSDDSSRGSPLDPFLALCLGIRSEVLEEKGASIRDFEAAHSLQNRALYDGADEALRDLLLMRAQERKKVETAVRTSKSVKGLGSHLSRMRGGLAQAGTSSRISATHASHKEISSLQSHLHSQVATRTIAKLFLRHLQFLSRRRNLIERAVDAADEAVAVRIAQSCLSSLRAFASQSLDLVSRVESVSQRRQKRIQRQCFHWWFASFVNVLKADKHYLCSLMLHAFRRMKFLSRRIILDEMQSAMVGRYAVYSSKAKAFVAWRSIVMRDHVAKERLQLMASSNAAGAATLDTNFSASSAFSGLISRFYLRHGDETAKLSALRREFRENKGIPSLSPQDATITDVSTVEDFLEHLGTSSTDSVSHILKRGAGDVGPISRTSSVHNIPATRLHHADASVVRRAESMRPKPIKSRRDDEASTVSSLAPTPVSVTSSSKPAPPPRISSALSLPKRAPISYDRVSSAGSSKPGGAGMSISQYTPDTASSCPVSAPSFTFPNVVTDIRELMPTLKSYGRVACQAKAQIDGNPMIGPSFSPAHAAMFVMMLKEDLPKSDTPVADRSLLQQATLFYRNKLGRACLAIWYDAFLERYVGRKSNEMMLRIVMKRMLPKWRDMAKRRVEGLHSLTEKMKHRDIMDVFFWWRSISRRLAETEVALGTIGYRKIYLAKYLGRLKKLVQLKRELLIKTLRSIEVDSHRHLRRVMTVWKQFALRRRLEAHIIRSVQSKSHGRKIHYCWHLWKSRLGNRQLVKRVFNRALMFWNFRLFEYPEELENEDVLRMAFRGWRKHVRKSDFHRFRQYQEDIAVNWRVCALLGKSFRFWKSSVENRVKVQAFAVRRVYRRSIECFLAWKDFVRRRKTLISMINGRQTAARALRIWKQRFWQSLKRTDVIARVILRNWRESTADSCHARPAQIHRRMQVKRSFVLWKTRTLLNRCVRLARQRSAWKFALRCLRTWKQYTCAQSSMYKKRKALLEARARRLQHRCVISWILFVHRRKEDRKDKAAADHLARPGITKRSFSKWRLRFADRKRIAALQSAADEFYFGRMSKKQSGTLDPKSTVLSMERIAKLSNSTDPRSKESSLSLHETSHAPSPSHIRSASGILVHIPSTKTAMQAQNQRFLSFLRPQFKAFECDLMIRVIRKWREVVVRNKRETKASTDMRIRVRNKMMDRVFLFWLRRANMIRRIRAKDFQENLKKQIRHSDLQLKENQSHFLRCPETAPFARDVSSHAAQSKAYYRPGPMAIHEPRVPLSFL